MIATLQAAGFQSVAALARPEHFDLWAIATKSALDEAKLRALAVSHFPAA